MIVDYTEAQFDTDMVELADTIKSSQMVYDKILAVARGGITPAFRLGYHLNIPVEIVSYSLKDETRFANLQDVMSTLSQQNRILIVDDISDSGKTLQEIATAMESKFTFDTATILFKPHTSAFIPTYYATTHNTDEWIRFFWEVELFSETEE